MVVSFPFHLWWKSNRETRDGPKSTWLLVKCSFCAVDGHPCQWWTWQGCWVCVGFLACLPLLGAGSPSDGTVPLSACRTIDHDHRIRIRLGIQAGAGGRTPGGSGGPGGAAGGAAGPRAGRGAAPGAGAVRGGRSAQHACEEGGEPASPRTSAIPTQSMNECLLSFSRLCSDLDLLALAGTWRVQGRGGNHRLSSSIPRANGHLSCFKTFSEWHSTALLGNAFLWWKHFSSHWNLDCGSTVLSEFTGRLDPELAALLMLPVVYLSLWWLRQ